MLLTLIVKSQNNVGYTKELCIEETLKNTNVSNIVIYEDSITYNNVIDNKVYGKTTKYFKNYICYKSVNYDYDVDYDLKSDLIEVFGNEVLYNTWVETLNLDTYSYYTVITLEIINDKNKVTIQGYDEYKDFLGAINQKLVSIKE